MATELTVQSERAFQKQPHIFLNNKSKAKSSKVGKGGRRWYKDIGLGFRTPKTAIEGNYIGRSIFGSLNGEIGTLEGHIGGMIAWLEATGPFLATPIYREDEKFMNIRSEVLTQNSHR
jgi:small subunit ribosomal protein S11e